ncbi:hypothetical protein T069G_06583 [Trichoderma breve]|uniref:Uncharacterized protein n=1 Tax=Trichoderma breve TaxID=2034170 RepID=A0A9W9BEE0_9HYPO|nr:hypothetical protein T069G_06583 [Trichoderma breve]KAJ4858316.1 hypothetical protein T069G_06583 [Trichoderma breve]
MWCLRRLLFVATVFSGRAFGRATVIVSETPDPIYLTTTIMVYDGTVTPTDSVGTSTSFSDIPSVSPTPSSHHALFPPHPAAYAPLPGFIPKLKPANEEFSSAPRLTTFITHTIPRETTTDSSSSLTVTATSTSSAAPALEQSDTSSPPSSRDLTKGEIVGLSIGVTVVVIVVVLYTMSIEECVEDAPCCSPRYHPCWNLCCCLMLVPRAACRGLTCQSRKKQAEPLESLRVDVEGETTLESPRDDVQTETTPVELDATNEVIGELSAPETTPYHSHPPLTVPVVDGSGTLSHQ